MSVRITCINKDNGHHYDPHEAITHLGWVNESTQKRGKSTRAEIVKFLEDNNSAYTKDGFGKIAYLVVRISQAGNKYVKTIADGRETDNLLYLMECV
jgi:hypothetical protein